MALGSGNWVIAGASATATTAGRVHENTYIKGKMREVHLKLMMPASGWPAAGVPLPGAASIGMYRSITKWQMSPAIYASGKVTATIGVVFGLTSGGKIIKMYRSETTSGVPGAKVQTWVAATQALTSQVTFYLTAYGW